MPTQEAINQNFEDRIKSIEDSYTKIVALLKPISETYTTVSNLGKLTTAIIVLLGIIVGMVVGLKKIF